MNLSAATLFPDLDGLGVSTAEFIRLTVDERSGEQQTNGPGLSGWSASQAPLLHPLQRNRKQRAQQLRRELRPEVFGLEDRAQVPFALA